MISLNLIAICVKVVFSLGRECQYVGSYLLGRKIGYMAMKTTEQEMCLESSFDAGFVAKSNIDAVQQKQNASVSRRNNFDCKQNWTVYSSTDQEGIPLPIITESTMWIYGRANIFLKTFLRPAFISFSNWYFDEKAFVANCHYKHSQGTTAHQITASQW